MNQQLASITWWAIVLSLVLKTEASPLTLRGADSNQGDNGDLMASSVKNDHDDQATMLSFFDSEDAPSYQRNLLSGNFIDHEHFFQEALFGSQDHHGRALGLVDDTDCVTDRSSIDFFDIEIKITAKANRFDCQVADTLMLGHDINRMLWDYGIGAEEGFDNVIFLAGVCPQPASSNKRALVTATSDLQRVRFIYAGPGACRYCGNGDNMDRRDLAASAWFLNEFKPQLESTLTSAIRRELVPIYQNCLGLRPEILVTVTGVEIGDLANICPAGSSLPTDQIGFLESYNLADVLLNPIVQTTCSNCINLDWSTYPDGTPVPRGGSVAGNEWLKEYHISLSLVFSAQGQPSQHLATFDTSKIGKSGDFDFGSPNESCPGGGPGKGIGGRVGSPGVNCAPLNNVLIIQDNKIRYPQVSKTPGYMYFYFAKPTLVSDIGLMDFDENEHTVLFYYEDSFQEVYTFEGYGDNGVQRVVVNKENVRHMLLYMPGSGAVTEINYCLPCEE